MRQKSKASISVIVGCIQEWPGARSNSHLHHVCLLKDVDEIDLEEEREEGVTRRRPEKMVLHDCLAVLNHPAPGVVQLLVVKRPWPKFHVSVEVEPSLWEGLCQQTPATHNVNGFRVCFPGENAPIVLRAATLENTVAARANLTISSVL